MSQKFINPFSSLISFPDSSVGKESTCYAGDPGSIPGLGRSPGEGHIMRNAGLEDRKSVV